MQSGFQAHFFFRTRFLMASRLVAGLALVVLGLVAFLAEVLLRVVVVLRAGVFWAVGGLVVLFFGGGCWRFFSRGLACG